jgi:hypothetical protein
VAVVAVVVGRGLDAARPVVAAVWHRALILLLRAPEEVHAEVLRRLALRHRQQAADAAAMLPLMFLQHPLDPRACCS